MQRAPSWRGRALIMLISQAAKIMANELVAPDKFFLNRFGMNHGALERILGSALERKADYADLYFEYRSAEGLALEESMVNHTSKSVSHGVGVRVCAEDRTGYAYSDEVTVDRMRLAAEAARAIADQRGTVPAAVQVGTPVARHALYDLPSTPLDVPVQERAKLLNEIDRIARAADPRVKNVMASFACEQKIVMVVNSDGQVAADVQPLCRLNVTVIADDGKARQMGSYGGGGRVEWNYFIENDRWREYALEAARQAIVNLDAVDAPRARWSWCSDRDGRGFCCTKRLATASKATSTARACRPLPIESARKSRASSVR